MRIVSEGVNPSTAQRVGMFRCIFCKTVIETTEKDLRLWREAGDPNDQKDGVWWEIQCPVCTKWIHHTWATSS